MSADMLNTLTLKTLRVFGAIRRLNSIQSYLPSHGQLLAIEPLAPMGNSETQKALSMKSISISYLLATTRNSSLSRNLRIPAIAAALIAAFQLAPVAAQETFKRISSRGQINIGYVDDLPPFSYNDSDGQPAGYSIDLCRPIVERVLKEVAQPAIRIKFLPVATDQWERVVASGGVDIWCASASNTAERRKLMAFSAPIFITSVKFAARAKDKIATLDQLRGQTVAIMGRTTAEQAVNEFGAKNGLALKISRALSADAGMGQLALGHATAFALDEVLLLDKLRAQRYPLDYSVLPWPLSTELIAIAFARDDVSMRRAVDETLKSQVRSGKVDAAYEKWFIKSTSTGKPGLNLPMSAELRAALAR
jgi:glutamate/aspartate transport system substrate-binding protein